MSATVYTMPASGSVTYTQAAPIASTTYMTSPSALPVTSQYVADWSNQGVPVTSMAYPAYAAPQAQTYVTSGSMAAPAGGTPVYTCPPEIFAKLASGGTLTPEEMAQLTGQAPAPAVTSYTMEQVVEAPAAVAPVAPAIDSPTAPAKGSKKKSSKKKDSLKSSKKKAKRGCCTGA
mmetsp:Transcript_32334/g.48784  ORF Transcript_32334/g.48784 Transcript_32334/m.48784 type:complete len:175 (+) Transcript_32334:72-596(+)|eukprot:CAMPEP_0194765172 /NCGR_PEP_ID=MMETSP0323_2-20130528/25303_1 /TAXON_ID=2866 ORGANISM="Crypthecodinium cohnii, Strain Seligo" /NCGR_SAMPLE_ID=MMETSP0323_2 /ASSEMBLY_ACC=CAM_ASM_000346 /LENGTH=174 /DNA_ID=CAMNT_0039694045 /DNA_START=60 /DNA_END=584 /DNA_ORIENTATION=+